MTKTIRLFFFTTAALGVTACGDDDVVALDKAEVDDDALDAGIDVTLTDDNLGVVELPFSEPVPDDVDDATFAEEMESAVILQVQSRQTGAIVNLGDSGMLVEGTPAAAGEFTWSLSEDRMTAQFVFYNDAGDGLDLDPAGEYHVALQVNLNDYVETLPEVVFPVDVSEG